MRNIHGDGERANFAASMYLWLTRRTAGRLDARCFPQELLSGAMDARIRAASQGKYAFENDDVELIVYAGAVMILFIFIIALLGGKKELKEPSQQRSIAFWFVFILFGELLMVITVGATKPIEGIFDPINLKVIGGAKAIGIVLFSRHLIPFEIASVLLLVATVGIICLAKFPLRRFKRRTP